MFCYQRGQIKYTATSPVLHKIRAELKCMPVQKWPFFEPEARPGCRSVGVARHVRRHVTVTSAFTDIDCTGVSGETHRQQHQRPTLCHFLLSPNKPSRQSEKSGYRGGISCFCDPCNALMELSADYYLLLQSCVHGLGSHTARHTESCPFSIKLSLVSLRLPVWVWKSASIHQKRC